MNMSVKKRFGSIHVRGGRILRVAHAHQVRVTSYDARVDDEAGRPRRAFRGDVEPAAVGDLAVEILFAHTASVAGYGYLSGQAINLIRYVDDRDRDRVAGWFTAGLGIRFQPFAPDTTSEALVRSMMRIKYGYADVAVAHVQVDDGHVGMAMETLAAAFSYYADVPPSPETGSCDWHPEHDEVVDIPKGQRCGVAATHRIVWLDGSKRYSLACGDHLGLDHDAPQCKVEALACGRPYTHVMTKVTSPGKVAGFVHLQPPKDAQEHACHPFFHDLLQSSPHLQDDPF
jgi:hypothetical protein